MRLRICVETARGLPAEGGAIRTMLAGLDLSSLSPDALGALLAGAGVEGATLLDRMAGINETLNALPPALGEKILVEYLNDLFRHRDA